MSSIRPSIIQNEAAKFLLALQFLTRLPIPRRVIYNEQRFADTPRYYPLVGMLIGLLCGLCYLAASLLFGHNLSILIAIALTTLLTGAFHEDGLADTFDGIGGGLTRENALNIMKDSRLGTYGTLAILFVLGTKIIAMMSLPMQTVFVGLIAGHGLSRLSSVIVMLTSHYVRDHGTGKPVSTGISSASSLIAMTTGVLCLLLVALFISIYAVVYCLIGMTLGHSLMRLYYSKKLGGYTGDTLGAVQQSSELGFFLGLAAWV